MGNGSDGIESRTLIEAALKANEPSSHGSSGPLRSLVLRELKSGIEASTPTYLISDVPTWDSPNFSPRAKILGECMLLFDALANRFQLSHRRKLIVTSLAAFGFIFLFEIYCHGLEGNNLVLGGALACLVASILTVHGLKSRDTQIAYLSCRTLAEILRIRFYADLAGMKFEEHEHVPRRYSVMMRPLTSILNHIYREISDLPCSALPREAIQQNWFNDQVSYHIKKTKQMTRTAGHWENASRFAFGLACVSLLALFVTSFVVELPPSARKILLIMGPTLLAAAGIAKFFSERLGHRSMAERAANCDKMFKINEERPWLEELEKVTKETTHEVIDWYVASMEREVGVPTG